MISKKRKTSLKQIISFVVVFLLAINIAPVVKINASSQTVAAAGNSLTETTNYYKFNLTLKNDGGIVHYNGSYNDPGAIGTDMEKGKPYTAFFNLNYFGYPLTVKSTVTLLSDVPDGATCRAFIDGNDLLQVGWTAPVKVRWETEIYDQNNTSYLKYFLYGFLDPDESDYEFDTVSSGKARDVYYVDAKGTYDKNKQAINYYNYLTDENKQGFYRVYDEIITFDNAIFAVSMFDGEESFVFSSVSPTEGAIEIPHLYSNLYNVLYNANREVGANGAPVGPDNITVTNELLIKYNETKEVKPNTFTTVGYTFTGWNTSPDGKGDDYVAGNTYKNFYNIKPGTTATPDVENPKVFYAQWTPTLYPVLYDANRKVGANNAPAGPDDKVVANQLDNVYNVESNSIQTNTFTTVGYTFAGWNTKQDGSGDTYVEGVPYKNLCNLIPETSQIDLDNPVTLYALWTPTKYPVLYDANREVGANNAPPGPDDKPVANQTDNIYNVESNSIQTNTFTTVGYTFAGWNTKQDGSGDTYVEGVPYKNLCNLIPETSQIDLDNPVTLYAQWKPWRYYIDYNAGGGSGRMDMQTFGYGDKMESMQNSFYRDGYSFVRFDYEYEGVVYPLYGTDDFREKLEHLGPESKITLVAIWRLDPVDYKIPVTGIDK